MNTQDYIREFILIAFIQKRIIIVTMAAIAIIAVLIAFWWPPTYSAVASVLVKHKKLIKSPEIEKVRLSAPRVMESDVFSEMKIVTSNALIEDTIRTLQEEGRIFSKGKMTRKEMRRNIAKIQGNLRTEIIPRSDVFNVTFRWRDPMEAETILQTLLDRYLSYRANIYSPRQVEIFFKKQLDNFDSSLRKMEDNLMDVIESSNSPRPDKVIDNNLLIEKNLEQQLNILINRYVERKEYLKYLRKALHSKRIEFFSFVNNVAIGDLAKQLQSLIIKKGDFLRVYAPQSSKVKRVQEEINNVSRSLKEEVRRYVNGEEAKLQGVEKAIESLKKRLKEVTDKNVKLYRDSIEKQRIKRKISLLENSYNTFAKRWEEAKIDQNTDANRIFSVSIVGKAQASMTPVFPNKRTIIPIGILVGMLTGFTVGFVREFFDHTFKRPEEVENYLALPTLFTIPRF